MLAIGLCWGFSCGSLEAAEPTRVHLKTSVGDIVLELDLERAPVTVNNFITYVQGGFYDGTVFHRVMQNFMIQGGGYDQRDLRNEKKSNKPIQNESMNGLSNTKYTIAMARTPDPNSATSQFFINTVDNHSVLDRNSPQGDSFGYCVFGKVIDGHKVVDAIAATQVSQDARGEMSQPLQAVVIQKAELLSRTK